MAWEPCVLGCGLSHKVAVGASVRHDPVWLQEELDRAQAMIQVLLGRLRNLGDAEEAGALTDAARIEQDD